jgi:hypothetical protein
VFGLLDARRTSKQVLFELGQFVTGSYHTQAVALQVVGRDVLFTHACVVARAEKNLLFFCAASLRQSSFSRNCRWPL